jgi:hypothetical protein
VLCFASYFTSCFTTFILHEKKLFHLFHFENPTLNNSVKQPSESVDSRSGLWRHIPSFKHVHRVFPFCQSLCCTREVLAQNCGPFCLPYAWRDTRIVNFWNHAFITISTQQVISMTSWTCHEVCFTNTKNRWNNLRPCFTYFLCFTCFTFFSQGETNKWKKRWNNVLWIPLMFVLRDTVNAFREGRMKLANRLNRGLLAWSIHLSKMDKCVRCISYTKECRGIMPTCARSRADWVRIDQLNHNHHPTRWLRCSEVPLY